MKGDKKKVKNKKGGAGSKNLDALNALDAATEQTLKVPQILSYLSF